MSPVDSRGYRPDDAEGLLRRLAGLPPQDPGRAALRRRAVLAAMPLARQLAHRYAGRGEPLDDRVQVAAVAVVRAVDGYRPGPGTSFTRYAVPTIRGQLRNHFRDTGWGVKVPRPLREEADAVRAGTDALAQRLGRTPSTADVAAYLHLPGGDIRAARHAERAYRQVSLDALIDDRAGPGRGDVLAV
jgi:RNA polymerase sigma-B factor